MIATVDPDASNENRAVGEVEPELTDPVDLSPNTVALAAAGSASDAIRVRVTRASAPRRSEARFTGLLRPLSRAGGSFSGFGLGFRSGV
jgi:hypothetical protein